MSGILSGSSFGTQVQGPYVADQRSGVGHLVMAIDISKCRPLVDFERDMITLIKSLKASPLAQGFDEVFYPGEMEARTEKRLLRDGISVPVETIEALNKGAKEIGVEPLPL